MKTKKSSIDDCRDRFEYQDVLGNLILVQFHKELKYDYTIPPPCDVLKIVSDSLEQWKTKSKLKEEISEIVEESAYQGDAILRKYLFNDLVFGHEWFYMLGDFFRYRQGEKGKAMSQIYNHPKIVNIVNTSDKVEHHSPKKEVEEFLVILNKNIEKYYQKLEKEKK